MPRNSEYLIDKIRIVLGYFRASLKIINIILLYDIDDALNHT